MRAGARVSAAIELLDLIIEAARDNGPPADRIIRDYFKQRRYAGSKDRRAVGEYVWEAVRRFGERPPSGRAAMLALAADDGELAALFTGEGHDPAEIAHGEKRAGGGSLPHWLMPYLAQPEGGLEHAALLERAPLDVRVNLSRSNLADMCSALEGAAAIEGTLGGIRLPSGTQIEQSAAYVEGLIDIQDKGSQLIVQACKAAAGMTVLDLCAGAGGKTLALADAMMADGALQGRLIAADVARVRLSKLMPRAERAGFSGIEERLLDPGKEAAALADLTGACDAVLVDAPCSGSGTWRRGPETRWRLSPDRLQKLVETQAMLLDLAVSLVKEGGALIYAVCALTKAEGQEQVDAFLLRHPDFRAADVPFAAGRKMGGGRLLTPCHDGSDGFFVARLEKTS